MDLVLSKCTGEPSFPRILCLLQHMLLAPLLGMRCLWMCRLISRCLAVSMTISLFGCQHCAVLLTTVLWYGDAFNVALFAWGCFGYLWSFVFSKDFNSVFSTPMKNAVGIFMGNAKKCWFLLVIWAYFLLLLLLIHECEMSLCLLVSSSVNSF